MADRPSRPSPAGRGPVTPSDAREAGQRIARARRRRGLSQAALAGLVGRSESWLSQVERGIRTADSHTLLTRLADVLRVGIEELAGPVPGEAPGRAYASAPQIEQAMLSYPAAAGSIFRATGNLPSRPCGPPARSAFSVHAWTANVLPRQAPPAPPESGRRLASRTKHSTRHGRTRPGSMTGS
jgi:transcriptional regulator with XRE-family HTH domain